MASTVVVEDDNQAVAQRTPKQIAWGRFKRNRVGVYAGYASIFFVLIGFLAPIITRLVGVNPRDTYEGLSHHLRCQLVHGVESLGIIRWESSQVLDAMSLR